MRFYKGHFHPNFDVRLVSDTQMGDITGGAIPEVFFVRHDSVVKAQRWDISSPWSSELGD